jgi:hypothetical protein
MKVSMNLNVPRSMLTWVKQIALANGRIPFRR